jgi:hypothetical protein
MRFLFALPLVLAARGGAQPVSAGRWQIVHYNLAITVPNERFKAVQEVIGGVP